VDIHIMHMLHDSVTSDTIGRSVDTYDTWSNLT